MFKKVTTCLNAGLNKVLEIPHTQVKEAINRRYPDLPEVLEVLERISGSNEAIEGECVKSIEHILSIF